MLVVVDDRDIELFLEPLFDLETPRRRDVLEVDAPEGSRDVLHGLDDRVGVLGPESNGKGIDACKFLKDHCLALHYRHGRLRADVAEAEDRGAVRDDGHGVPFDGIPEGMLAVFMDVHGDAGHTRGVDLGKVIAVPHRHPAADLDLPAFVAGEGPVHDAPHVHTF